MDLGIAQVAVTDDGEAHAGEAGRRVRERVREHRPHLQARNTRSAFKRLQKTCRQQPRFVRDVNHRLAKPLVSRSRSSPVHDSERCRRNVVAVQNQESRGKRP